MNASPTPQLEELVREKVDSGRDTSARARMLRFKRRPQVVADILVV